MLRRLSPAWAFHNLSLREWNSGRSCSIPQIVSTPFPRTGGTYMSIMFRTKTWLTLGELATAWARELSGPEQDFDLSRSRLLNRLLEDAVNGRLDDIGPLVEDQRLGLRIITPDFRAGFLKGVVLLNGLKSGADLTLLQDRIVIMKEAKRRADRARAAPRRTVPTRLRASGYFFDPF